jgi:SEC-C motif domain protein
MLTPLCPCGSAKPLTQCCGLYHSGVQLAPSPEALMRSRYSAYCLGHIDYLVATMREPALSATSRETMQQTAQHVQWCGLRILATPSSCCEAHGIVEFIAYYTTQGQSGYLHERSDFEYYNGAWYYTQGQAGQLAIPKFGRNEPCLCGSGKKIKHCCLEHFCN